MPVAEGQLTLLVVEDDPGDVLIITEALESLGPGTRVVHVAADGRDALEFLRHEGDHADAPRPDMIFLDLNMPRMDGRELLQILKSDPDLRTIPTVVFTTSSSQEDVVASYERYANAYVSKPVDLEDFGRAVLEIEHFFSRTALLPSRSNRRRNV